MSEAPYRNKEELQKIAERLVDVLRTENLTIWQAREVFRIASSNLDREKLK